MRTLKESILDDSDSIIGMANDAAKKYDELKERLLKILKKDITKSIQIKQSNLAKDRGGYYYIKYTSAPSTTRIFNRLANDIRVLEEYIAEFGLKLEINDGSRHAVRSISIQTIDGRSIFNIWHLTFMNSMSLNINLDWKDMFEKLTE